MHFNKWNKLVVITQLCQLFQISALYSCSWVNGPTIFWTTFLGNHVFIEICCGSVRRKEWWSSFGYLQLFLQCQVLKKYMYAWVACRKCNISLILIFTKSLKENFCKSSQVKQIWGRYSLYQGLLVLLSTAFSE